MLGVRHARQWCWWQRAVTRPWVQRAGTALASGLRGSRVRVRFGSREGQTCSIHRKNSLKHFEVVLCPSGGIFDVPSVEARLSELEALVASPDLWDDNNRAQGLLKERTDLQARLESVSKPWGDLDDVEVLIELGELEDDESVGAEMSSILSGVEGRVADLEFQRIRKNFQFKLYRL